MSVNCEETKRSTRNQSSRYSGKIAMPDTFILRCSLLLVTCATQMNVACNANIRGELRELF